VNAIRQKWQLTREGLDKFLVALSPERDEAARIYEALRGKLISYFDWRNCPMPEDHADEVLNRLIRKIDQGEPISDPSTYVFGIARMVLLEISRAALKERTALSELRPVPVEADDETTQHRIVSLRECLSSLSDKDRKLITLYYENEGGASKILMRKQLARSLDLELNALRIRACRLRERLEQCMKRRLARLYL
jgi:DNA-directed RNA polymerase specialized sigma24 family protein